MSKPYEYERNPIWNHPFHHERRALRVHTPSKKIHSLDPESRVAELGLLEAEVATLKADNRSLRAINKVLELGKKDLEVEVDELRAELEEMRKESSKAE